jgi:hypothetical protein
MRVLLTPDWFTGSLTAEQVAEHLRTGKQRSARDAVFDPGNPIGPAWYRPGPRESSPGRVASPAVGICGDAGR